MEMVFILLLGMFAIMLILGTEKHGNGKKLAEELEKKLQEKQKEIERKEIEIAELEVKFGNKKLILEREYSNKRISLEKEFRLSESRQKENIDNLVRKVDELVATKEKLNNEVIGLRGIKSIKKELKALQNELDLYDTNLYLHQYDYENSQLFEAKLNEIIEKQKLMIKDKSSMTTWADRGNSYKSNWAKFMLRSFNTECEIIISKVKYNTVESSVKKIKETYEKINKLGIENLKITQPYLNLKIEELYLRYEYQCKVKEEQDEQKRIREIMKEEAKVLEEIEKAKAKIEKEESHFNNAISQLMKQLEEATKENERLKIEQKINAFNDKLKELEKEKINVLERESNNKAGYVYIISNIGTFGEENDIYKIGTTRRLEPMERIKELSNASVPFKYDVHAMIFSENAFELETALHQHFSDRRVNKVNHHKEFFKVPIEEIEEVVRDKFNGTVEFTKVALAEEYRQSVAMAEV